ncbi:MAG TPA: Uma2 family endonuclease [Gemmatimonadales bacterium]|nr:Uma2 family endonuclease [Gemmatimonadales bacterium]
MAMSEMVQRWTAQMVRELPDDGKRYEVVHGELLVTPAPRSRHQIALGRLYAWIRAYLERLGRPDTVVFSPADISWTDDTLVQPDLFVVPPEEISNNWETFKTLLLAVEVVSPSSTRADRILKRRLYQEQRVRTYWIVDLDAALVEVWHPEDERPEIVTDALRWRVIPEAPELTIAVADLLGGLPPR